MTIFNIEDNGPTAAQLADGFLKETNQKADQNALEAADAIQRFWYRNQDEQGNPSLEGDNPTGIEVLQAMGTKAQAFMLVAYARVQMLLTVQQSLGVQLVDLSEVSSPYDLTFNQDGSLNTWTLKN